MTEEDDIVLDLDYNPGNVIPDFEEDKDPRLTNVAGSPSSASEKQLAANRRNAQLSTGPKTKSGKQRSRCNALKHGILASKLLVTDGVGAEDCAAFEGRLSDLKQDLQPHGRLEELLVEEIAVCYWRWGRALQAEAVSLKRAWDAASAGPAFYRMIWRKDDPPPATQPVKYPPSLPPEEEMNRILRYETSIHRQLSFALNQLERLQRARKGEHVPAPLSVEITAGN